MVIVFRRCKKISKRGTIIHTHTIKHRTDTTFFRVAYSNMLQHTSALIRTYSDKQIEACWNMVGARWNILEHVT